jgi:hypothetical protein
MGQTFADGIAPWDIIISLAICRHDEKIETGKKREIRRNFKNGKRVKLQRQTGK